MSWVYVFDTAEGAAAYFKESTDGEIDRSATSGESWVPEEVRDFDADVADQASGFHSNGPVEVPDGTSYRMYSSGVEFRRGRLVAGVGFLGLDELGNEDHLKDLARRLDQRIVEVLEGQAQAQEEPEQLVMRPGAILVTSGERFAQEVKTFQGVFHSTITDGGSRFRMTGDFAFRSPDTMYMIMEIMGETMDFLMVAPDLYVRLPDGGWRVITDESIGLDRDALQAYLENRGPVDYAGTTAQLENLTQLPDETLDRVTCLHYEGTLDIGKLMDELPEGIYDPAVLEQVRDFWEPMSVEVWVDKETYLPRRMDEEVTLGVEPSRFSMDMSMEFSGYNEPVDIPEPPIDARPLDLEDMGGL